MATREVCDRCGAVVLESVRVEVYSVVRTDDESKELEHRVAWDFCADCFATVNPAPGADAWCCSEAASR